MFSSLVDASQSQFLCLWLGSKEVFCKLYENISPVVDIESSILDYTAYRITPRAGIRVRKVYAFGFAIE
ncbi:hypothetical protein D3Z48_14035 [Clostridiaceae bacterium]|nr:hypothetical protein [Clostridiaceae bacterium]